MQATHHFSNNQIVALLHEADFLKEVFRDGATVLDADATDKKEKRAENGNKPIEAKSFTVGLHTCTFYLLNTVTWLSIIHNDHHLLCSIFTLKLSKQKAQ